MTSTRAASSASRRSCGGRTRSAAWSTRGLFVSLAEELGLIEGIDSFVLRSACMQVRQWRQEGLWDPGLVMSVNLSPGRLIDPDLAQRITRQLEECEFDPRSLILEITESAMLADNETTVRNLAELRSLGVRIALDDFGTGYSRSPVSTGSRSTS